MGAYVMKDMELDDEAKADLAVPYPCETGVNKKMEPEYPWGLRICLTNAELEKLGLKVGDCTVGGTIHGHFMAAITSVSSDQRESGSSDRVELQIKQMCLESEDDENAEQDAAEDRPARRRLKAVYKS
ncbi:MAG: capsid staple protein [Alphaproteobacteria bacterium]